jgi:hypothetical protein
VALAIALCAIAGLFIAAARAHRDILDRSNHDVGESAAAFLAAVTPAPGGQYDPARLVSGASALAGAWFFPGGIQLVVGRTPLLPDSLGIAPRLDHLAASQDTGSVLLALPHGHRAAVVPFINRSDSLPIGWLAVWDTLPDFDDPDEAVLFGMLSFSIAIWLGVASRRGAARLRRDMLVVLSAAAAALAGFALNAELQRSAEAATEIRLQVTRRLMEIASTADGVRSTALLHLAPGLLLERVRGGVERRDSVEWQVQDREKLGTVVAIRPTGGAFRLTGIVSRWELDRAQLVLVGVWCALLVALLLAADARGGSGERRSVLRR